VLESLSDKINDAFKPGKRGRKTENWEKYIATSKEGIRKIKEKKKTANVKDRMKLRN